MCAFLLTCALLVQIDEVRLCKYNPTFVGDIEHSDDDLQALIDELHAPVDPTQFRSNSSKKTAPAADGNATAGAAVSKEKAKLDYSVLFPPEVKARVDVFYQWDFVALGYMPELGCISGR